MTSTPSKCCATCGAALPQEIASSRCPACLLEFGLSGALANTPVETALASQRARAVPTRRDAGDPSMQLFCQYDLIKEIARGGQGVVYRAHDTKLNRDVALKMLPIGPWTTDSHLTRFRTEASLAAELDHPAIVPIYEIGECEGQPYYTMKLIDGLGLNQLLPGSLSQRRSVEILATVARALEHAHARGVLHRDIKPGNIILDTEGRPHITDFGLAKLIAGENALTQTLEVLGTPGYISPEMAQGTCLPSAPTTDVYGLGAVLYHLLTSRPPFASGTMLDTVRQVVATDPRPLRELDPAIDRDLELICLKCLEKDPVRRYPSAAAMADDLDRWLRHEPILARAPSAAYRTRKWIRRHSAAAAIVSVIALAGAIVGPLALNSGVLPPPHTLAVLFRPADEPSKYLTTEFSRNLIHALGKLPGVTVVPRGDVLKWEYTPARPQEVGRALDVPIILSGTIRQNGETLELRAELIAVGPGTSLWSRSLHGNLAGGPALQSTLVRIVAARLGIELNAQNRAELFRPRTKNAEAWLHYLRARQHMGVPSESELLAAISEFEQSLAHDPDFAEAYAGLGTAYFDLGYTFRDPSVYLVKARDSVRAALERDETLVEAIITHGVVKYFYDWDWDGAEQAVKTAVLLDPSALENHACYLHSLETVGRTDEALRIVQLAFARHPRSIAIQAELGCTAYYAGQLDEAATYWREALRSDGTNAYLHWGIGRTLAQQGKYAEASAVLEAGQLQTGGEWTGLVSELAYVRGRENRRDEALKLIEQLRTRAATEFVDPYLFAMAYCGIGDAAETFRHLDLAATGRSSWIPSLPVDPKFAHLHGDSRFQQVLARLKLPKRP